MNTTTTSPIASRTAHIALIVEQTRELYSMERTRETASYGPARALTTGIARMEAGRLEIVTRALRDGIDWRPLIFVCQHASDEQLQDLYCDRTDDAAMIKMIEGFMAI